LKRIESENGGIESVVSCLASRSGIKREAFQIDYQATLNCLEAGAKCDAKHFVLLSAICVRNPLLQFQLAKLKFEGALQAQSAMTWSIVRPTAFFKSVSGQLERLQDGASFLMFQDSTRCNPIAETDLATYLIDCISEESRRNKIINLGGPDKAMKKIEQGRVSDASILMLVFAKTISLTNLPYYHFLDAIQSDWSRTKVLQTSSLDFRRLD
jgi:divinyl chlorophyllide a 8-vinyl-reductase